MLLDVDSEGRRVFVGLTYRETLEYLGLRGLNRSNFGGTAEEYRVVPDRYQELLAKHDDARTARLLTEGKTKH